MAVTFPASPAVDDTVTDDLTGAVWVFDGQKWTHTPGAGSKFVPTEFVDRVPIAFSFAGAPLANATLNVAIAIPLRINLLESTAHCGTLATDPMVFNLYRVRPSGTASVGQVGFSNASEVGVFAGAGGDLLMGDVLQIVAPSPRDDTLEDVAITVSTRRL